MLPHLRESDDYHSGRPTVVFDATHAMVLCPFGHLMEAVKMEDWARSRLERDASDPSWTVECCGATPEWYRAQRRAQRIAS